MTAATGLLKSTNWADYQARIVSFSARLTYDVSIFLSSHRIQGIKNAQVQHYTVNHNTDPRPKFQMIVQSIPYTEQRIWTGLVFSRIIMAVSVTGSESFSILLGLLSKVDSRGSIATVRDGR